MGVYNTMNSDLPFEYVDARDVMNSNTNHVSILNVADIPVGLILWLFTE